MKLHHKIIKHVNKHHKKYLFWAGMAFGLSVIKIIVLIGVFLGIHMNIGKSNAANEKLEMYKTIEIFNRIDDIAHEEINEDPNENPFTTQELKDKFYEIDHEYHTATNINERYRAERKMIELLEEAEESRPTVTGDTETDFEKDEEYRELIEQFKEIR